MKKKLVKFVSSLLAAAFLASMFVVFAGCGGGGGKNNTKDDDDKTPVTPGYTRLTIYWNGDIKTTDLWIWTDSGTVSFPGGQKFEACSYGGKYSVEVPKTDSQVGFIVRTNVTPGQTTWDGAIGKDATNEDRFIAMSEANIVNDKMSVYLKQGDKKLYTSKDGGKTLEEMKAYTINMVDITTALNTISYSISPGTQVTKEMITVKDASGKEIQVVEVTSRGTSGTVTLGEDLDLGKSYTCTIEGYGSKPVVPNTYFNSDDFNSKYSYDGKLGVEITASSVVFRLWAPTSSEVRLNIYESGTKSGAPSQTFDLKGGKAADKGVWTYTGEKSLVGKYYTYTVRNAAGASEVVDPYARSTGVNGEVGMIVDLDKTDPAGWTNNLFVPKTATGGKFNYTDAELWEIHVRDFSNKITNSKYKGKYLAFTETGLTENGIPVGVDYLKQLGITHVHLLPSFDYASVNERNSANAFNWGYDPLNYNTPEGSYSTDPTKGEVRVNEFKQMVQALHKNNIGVVMDVVYNHTSGLQSNFQKIVPYYYYRFQPNGTAYNGSGCGNETASDRAMFRKFMIDSVTYWMEEYNVDGFRFDLMGLHDIETMHQLEIAVHKINPNALIYGEGWTGGTTGLKASEQTVLKNGLKKVNENVGGQSGNHTNGVAMFSDVIRDTIKGGVFNINDTGFATGAKSDTATLKKIMFSVNGSVANADISASNTSFEAYNPTNVVNYVSAHDNNTLWDRINYVYKTPADKEMNLNRNRLSAAIVQTSLGIPFMQAGEEMLRQKINANGSFNENSYNAPDSVNNLKWELLTADSDQYAMMNYYKGLIAFRQQYSVLRATDSTGIISNATLGNGKALISFEMTKGNEHLFVVYNASLEAENVTLPAGSWGLYINGTQAGTTRIGNAVNGGTSVSVTPISCYVYVLNG